jgi:hypothetical protein
MRLAGGALACLLVLTGCGGEPSEGDMRSAIEAHARAQLSKTGKPYHEFLDFRKQGCIAGKTKSGEYDCYYAAVIPVNGSNNPMSVNGKGRFRKEGGGFSFEDLGAQPR